MNLKTKPDTLEVFQQVANSQYNSFLQEWKQQGGKIAGYFYSYIPEELITAAGVLPFRIRGTGSTGTEFSDAHFSQINCGYVRHTFDLVLQSELEFLDGVAAYNACDHLRRLYDNWQAQTNSPCFHFINVPKKRGSYQTELYCEEIRLFKESIEEHFGVIITDDKLRDAIKTHNKTRGLQRKLYDLKRKNNPPLTGAETLAIMIAGTAMPKVTYNQLLQRLLEEIGDSEGSDAPKARLMVVIGEIENPAFMEVIESQGGIVVADSLLYGARTISSDVCESGDPINALASYYFEERPACPRIFGTGAERFKYIQEQAEAYDVDGIISVNFTFCDQWAFEQDDLTRFLKQISIPHLGLITEYIISNVGQLKTRIQAFMETIEEGKYDSRK